MKTWNVKYERIDDRQARHPFFKWSMQVEAETRKEAMETARARVGYPEKYDRWSASIVR